MSDKFSERFLKKSLAVAVHLVLAGAASPAVATPTYDIVDLSILNPQAPQQYYATGTALNDAGQVVGYVMLANENVGSFVWDAKTGTVTALAGLGGVNTYAYGINQSGQVAGEAATANGDMHAFVITAIAGGQTVDLGTLPGGLTSAATAINASGQVTGYADAGYPNTASHAVVGSLSGGVGSLADIGLPAGSYYSSGKAINASGQVVGEAYNLATASYHAFLMTPGVSGAPNTFIDLGTQPGWSNSHAYGVNDNSQVVGSADIFLGPTGPTGGSGGTHAFVYLGGSKFVDLGVLPGGFSATAMGINNHGQIVGYGSSAYGQSGFVSIVNGMQPIDLNSLLSPGSTLTILQASAINNNGQITGSAYDVNYNTHAFLATPTGTLNWAGGPTGSWDDAANWEAGFVPGPFLDVNIAAPAGQTLTVTGPTAPTTVKSLSVGANSRVVVAAASGLFATVAPVVGETVLTLAGGPLSAIDGINVLQGGRLLLAASNVLAPANSVVVDGGVLELAQGTSNSIGTLQGNGNVASQVLLDTGSNLHIGNGSAMVFDGHIDGGGSLAIEGNLSKLTLSGVNTYSGLTKIAQGASLNMSGAGSIAASSQVLVDGSFDISAVDSLSAVQTLPVGTPGAIQSLAGGGSVNLGSNTLTLLQANGNFSGTIDGSGGLRLLSGSQTLSGNNVYTGPTQVVGGTLNLQGGQAISASSGVDLGSAGRLNLLDSQTIGTLSSLVGGQVSLNANTLTTDTANDSTFGGVLSGSGGLVKQGAGTLVLSGANTYTGTTQVNSGTLALSGGAAIADTGAVRLGASGVLDVRQNERIGSLSGAPGSWARLNVGTLSTGDGGDSGFAGRMDGSGGLTKLGTGTFTLSGPVAYSGPTTVTAGRLVFSGDGVFTGTLATAPGSTLEWSGGNQQLNNSNIASKSSSQGTLLVSGGDVTVNGALSHGGGLQLTGGKLSVGASGLINTQSYTQTGGVLSGPGQVSAVTASLTGGQLVGPGKLTVTGAKGDGPDLVLGGNVSVGNGFILENQGKMLVSTGAIFSGGGSFVQTVGDVQVDGAWQQAQTRVEGGTFHGSGVVGGSVVNNSTIGGDKGGITFTGKVSGAGNYTGNVTFAGSFSPGNSPALIQAENITFAPTNILIMELGGRQRGTQYDAIDAKTVQLGGLLDVRLTNNFVPSLGDSFDLINAQSVNGQFTVPYSCPGGFGGLCRLSATGTGLQLAFLPMGSDGLSIEDALPAEVQSRLIPLLLQPNGRALYDYAIRQLSPQQQASMATMSGLSSQMQNTNLTRHLMDQRANRHGHSHPTQALSMNINGIAVPMNPTPLGGLGLQAEGAGGDEAFESRLGAFINAQFEFDNRSTTQRQRGFDSGIYGVTAGMDYWVSKQLLLGLAGGYNYTDTNVAGQGGTQRLNAYGLTGFASLYFDDNWYMDLMANGTYNQYDSSRHIDYVDAVGRVNTTATGSTDGLQGRYSMNLGYDLPVNEWTFGLRGRGEYINTPIGGYKERGASLGLNLQYQDKTAESLITAFGGTLSHAASTSIGVFMSQLVLEWEHQYKSPVQAFDASFLLNPTRNFVTKTDLPDRNYMNIRASVSGQFANGGSAFIQYDTSVGMANLSRHAVNVGVRLEF